MLYKNLFIYFLFFTLSLNVIASQNSNKDNEELVEVEFDANFDNIFSLEKALEDSEVRKFYDSLSEKERNDFVELIQVLNIKSQDILIKLVEVMQKHKIILNRYKDLVNIDNLKVSISFYGDALESKKCSRSFNTKDFCQNFESEEERVAFKEFYLDLQSCVEEGADIIAQVFDLFQDLKNKYKNYINQNLVISVGCEEDSVLPIAIVSM